MLKKNNRNMKTIFSLIMHAVGFILYVAFLSKIYNVSEEAWIYSFISIISSFGVVLFCCSDYLRQ